MKVLFFFLLLTSFECHAEFKAHINLSEFAREAVLSVEKHLGDTRHDLMLIDINLDFTSSLNEKSFLEFSIIDINTRKQGDECIHYTQYASTLELNKESGFSIKKGLHSFCDSEPNNLLAPKVAKNPKTS